MSAYSGTLANLFQQLPELKGFGLSSSHQLDACNRKQQLEEMCLDMGAHPDLTVCGICFYASVMTETHSQKAPVTKGSLIQDTEKWHPTLLTDWLDLFAKNLVMGN